MSIHLWKLEPAISAFISITQDKYISGEDFDYFGLICDLTYIVGTQKNCLCETVLCAHNVCFDIEMITKIY